MSEQKTAYVIDYQELDILEAISGVDKYWGIVSEEQMDLGQVNHRLFEMYKKKMIAPGDGCYRIADEYKQLLRYINTADAMLKIKIKGEYQQDCFCYVKEQVLVAIKNERKAGQARYEFIEKDAFGRFLTDGEYLPDKQGENLEDMEYGLSVIRLKPDGSEADIIDVVEENGMFYLGSGQEQREEYTLKRFEHLLWKIIREG